MMIKLLLKVSKITKFPHHISIQSQQCNYQKVIKLNLNSLSLPLSLSLSVSVSVSVSLPLSLFDTMVVDENNFIPDNQELHERIDREQIVQLTVLLVGKSKLYMIDLSVKPIITTSCFKNTMSYMRIIPKTTFRLMILMVLRFIYFKVRNFRGTKFRDFAILWQFRESFEPRNI